MRDRDEGALPWFGLSETDGSDDGLPGGFTFLPDEPPPVRRGLVRRVLPAVLTVALVAGLAVVAVQWQRDGDLRDVAEASSTTYTRVVQRFTLASDPTELATAAASAQAAADRLDTQRLRLSSRSSNTRAALARQVAGERDVAHALSGLGRIREAPLATWGSAQPSLTAAVSAELRSRSTLHTIDAGVAHGLPDTGAMLARVTSTVGAALVDDVQDSAGQLLDVLAGAKTTRELRTAAADAEAQRAAVLSARAGLDASSSGQVLDEFAAALAAVQHLAMVTPADTSVWPDARTQLTQHLTFVGSAATSLAAGSVRTRVPVVLLGVDDVVSRAAQAQAAWVPVHDAAVAQQAADAATLRRTADDVRSALADVAAVRTRLGSVVAQPITNVVAATALAPLSSALLLDVNRLRSDAAPAGTTDAATALVDRVTALAQPVEDAEQSLATDPCPDCSAWDGPAGAALEPALAVTWDQQTTAWEGAVTAAGAAIDARQLPPPPDV